MALAGGRHFARARYLLLTPSDGELAGRASVGWAEAAATPLCALSPVMQNRRILDGIVAAAGAERDPEPMVAGALLGVVRDVDLPAILDALLARYVERAPGPRPGPLRTDDYHAISAITLTASSHYGETHTNRSSRKDDLHGEGAVRSL